MATITPFDDSAPRSVARATRNPGTLTGPIDGYRQGVELTLSSHYGYGLVKIYAGFNGQTADHQVPQLTFGQTQNSLNDNPYYTDVLYSSPAILLGYAALGLQAWDYDAPPGTWDDDPTATWG